MKLVTQDYGCGTSSSILDYGIDDVVIVSPESYEHVYDVQDDLFFIGHDFLFFLWDSSEKLSRWQQHKHRKAVWCFERINAIVPAWKQKSEYSISILKQFVDQIFVCDEDDAQVYGDWLPQWASPVFYEKKDTPVTINKMLFSGQAGKPEYAERTRLLNQIALDPTVKDLLQITNFSRDYSWDVYCNNLLSYYAVLNPLGILRGFNTRTYETLYSGRVLLQQTAGHYDNHSKLLENHPNAIMFQTLDELKSKMSSISSGNPEKFFKENNIHARFRSIGVELK